MNEDKLTLPHQISGTKAYLHLYNEIYSDYIPYWKVGDNDFPIMDRVIKNLFYNMQYYLGIPQAILNLIVFSTVILITRHPVLGLNIQYFKKWKL